MDIKAVKLVREYLVAHASAQTPASALQKIAGMDRFTIACQFRWAFGTSPDRYRTLRRLALARAAIESGRSLGQAAAESGFDSRRSPLSYRDGRRRMTGLGTRDLRLRPASDVAWSHDFDKGSNGCGHPGIDGEQAAARQASQGDIFGVIRLGPAEAVRDPYGLLVQRRRPASTDREDRELLGRRRGQLCRDLTPPTKLVNHGRGLRPEKRWANEIQGLQGPDVSLRQAGLDDRRRVGYDQGSAAGSRSSERRKDVRQHLARRRRRPGAGKRQCSRLEQFREVGLLDHMLRADLPSPQASGSDPAPDCLGIPMDPLGRLRNRQHCGPMLQQLFSQLTATGPKNGGNDGTLKPAGEARIAIRT